MSGRIYRTSVRDLVEFVYRSGDIDNRIGTEDTLKAMQEGTRIHKKIQKQGGASYRPEVTLSILEELENYSILIEGRADGIFEEKDGVVIDEIKSTSLHVDKMEEAIYVHLAQAMCYAYIYAKDHAMERIDVQITYVEKNEAEDIRRFRRTCTFEELKAWYADLLTSYCKWIDYRDDWTKQRTASAKQLQFPYTYREGQKQLASDVYRTIQRKKVLFLQAPTGVGKTLSTVFPAVKAMGEGLLDRLFYLTAKTVTTRVASDTFDLLSNRGLQIKYVLLTAKEKMCLCEEMICNPEACPYAKGHFDRINDAVYHLLLEGGSFLRERILEAAEAFRVCPFELSLDLTDWTDVIIGDYNYVFDPYVKLKRYFADGRSGEYLFQVDEAHNLVERAREMYSAQIIKEDVLAVKRTLLPVSKRANKLLEKINRTLLELKRDTQGLTVVTSTGMLSLDLMRLSAILDEILHDHREFQDRDIVQQFYFQVRRFLQTEDLLDENYRIYTRILDDGSFVLKLFCVNPARNLQNCLDSGRSCIYFSATLLPVNYYKNLLSYEADPYAVYARSPFNARRRHVAIASDVSSKYTRRGPEEYKRAAAYIAEMVDGKKGNYLAFFPSYALLIQVLEAFSQIVGATEASDGTWQAEDLRILVQRSNMSASERDDFLKAFEEESEASLVGFCVLGGIFSEGIDLTGERLIGAAIYGTGLPQVDEERELLKTYYDGRGYNGFDYAYRYPGMNKVLQAAGRVIRTAQDRGVVLLMDERFLQRSYTNLFPYEWDGCNICKIESIGSNLKTFWEMDSDENKGDKHDGGML